MDVPFGLIMLVGKYIFLGLVYGFLYWAFRGLFAQSALEARSQRPLSASQPAAVPAPVAAPVLVVPQPVVAAVEVAAPAPEWVAPDVVPPLAPEPPPVAAPVKPALIVQDPGQSGLQAGQVIDLTAAVTIGRAEDNGLVLADKFCSTHHALIFLQSGHRILRDRGSTNGTFRNGQPLEHDVMLSDGDTLGMGSVVFKYRAGD